MMSRAAWIVVLVVAALAFGLGRACAPGGEGVAEHTHGADEVYTCSMHPQVRQPEPGTCPLCGMALVPASQVGGGEDDEDAVTLSKRAQQLARLRTEALGGGEVEATVTLTGRLVPAEDRLATVIAWAGGRVERLRVKARGEVVLRGQIVAELYSPELLAAHAELRAARAQLDAAGQDASPVIARSYRGARSRLELLGVPEDALDDLEQQEGPLRRVPLRSPVRGTVISREVTEGDEVAAGQDLLRVADLRVVWAELDADAATLARLTPGQSVTVQVDGLRVPQAGEVLLVEPTVDPARRLGRVRVALPNPDGLLRPGLLVRAEIAARGTEGGLWAPSSAVYQTGRRALVYVEITGADRPTYAPREVQLGARSGDRVELLAGVSPGERVVVHGAFVLDADMQLRGARSLLTLPDAPDPFARALPLSAAQRAQLKPLFEAYLRVQRALGDDDLVAAAAAARELTARLDARFEGDAAEVWLALSDALGAAAQGIAGEPDIEAARLHFQALAAAVQTTLERFGNPLDASLHIAFCPMTFDDGATWVQQGERIHNAFQGERMLRCGEIRGAVAPGSVLGRRE